MTLEQVRKCDVFGTMANVHAYHVEVTTKDADGQVLTCLSRDADLSNRGKKRLEKFVGRALAPPGKVVAEAKATE